jgi:hypothetical protein
MYEKGRPWQNLIESQFGIQARIGEYHWERCQSVEAAVEFRRDLIRDHNRLPHWAHRHRNDEKHSPLAVLGDVRGKRFEPADSPACLRATLLSADDRRPRLRQNRALEDLRRGRSASNSRAAFVLDHNPELRITSQ